MKKNSYLIIALLCAINCSFAQYGMTKASIYFKSGEVKSGFASIPMENGDLSPINPLGKPNEKVRYKATKKSKRKKFEARLIDSIVFTVTYTERIDKKRVKKTRDAKYIPVFLDKKKKKQGFAELIVDGKVKLVGRTVSYTDKTMIHHGTSVDAGGTTITCPPEYSCLMQEHNDLLVVREGHKAIKINQLSLSKAFKQRASEFFSDCSSLVSKIENKEFKKKDLIAIVEYYNSNCAK
ncbi:MAG: hypothetical protein AAFX55_17110 [Bacteroidota bacterium]